MRPPRQHKADPNITDIRGRTALDMATLYGFQSTQRSISIAMGAPAMGSPSSSSSINGAIARASSLSMTSVRTGDYGAASQADENKPDDDAADGPEDSQFRRRRAEDNARRRSVVILSKYLERYAQGKGDLRCRCRALRRR